MFTNVTATSPSHVLSKASKTLSLCGTALVSVALLTSTPAIAAPKKFESVTKKTETVYDAGKSRVNLSDRLQMLNQSISSSACQIGAQVNIEASQRELYDAKTEFGKIIKALRESDVSIGVPTAETKSRVLSQIWEVEKQWVKVKYASDRILEDDRIAKYVDVIGELSGELNDRLSVLSSEIVAQYSNPAEMLTGDAMRIKVAGRQRYLSKKMTKESCGIASAHKGYGAIEDLINTMGLFEKSLSALENGMPAAGIAPPPNEWVTGKLKEIRIKWWHAAHDAKDSAQSLTEIPRKNDQYQRILKEMDNLVTLYMTSDPGKENIYKKPLQAYAEEVLSTFTAEPALLDIVRKQNAETAGLTQSEIDEMDRQWRKEVKSADNRPMIDNVLGRDASKWLFQKQIESSGLITEVIITDKRGVNAAQSQTTTDYWQGDELKWKVPVLFAPGEPYVSPISFDQSTGRFQSQVSMSILDPETDEVIGTATFGINVQAFL